MHVLLITSDRYPPFRPASEAIFRAEFTRRGHRVDWLMPAEQLDGAHQVIRFGRGVVVAAPRDDRGSRMRRAISYLADFMNDLRIYGLTRRHKFDIIQVKDKYVTAVFCLAIARLRKIPFCFWLAYPHAEANLHGARHRIVRYPLFYWFRGIYQSLLLYKVLLPAANHVFVQSEQMRKDIAAKGIDRSKMTPIPGSLDLAKVPFRGGEDPGPTGKRVLYVGTLIRERRLDFLVRVFSGLPARHHDAELVFVGAGENPEDEALLEREIERTGVARERVKFAGRMPRGEVWRHIEESAVCVSPYFPTSILNSTSPTKLLEYMAMGRPVVANEHPEQTLVLNESGAGFAVTWDEQEFANAITEILDNPEKSRQMGAAGRKWVESNRSNRILADAVESVYESLV